MKVYLTHTPDALANYYGDRALAALRQVAEVRLIDTGRHLAGRELAEAAAGCQAIVSYRQSPGEAETFRHAQDLIAFLRCAVDIRNVDLAAASAAGVLVTRATPGFIPSVAELVSLLRRYKRDVCVERFGRYKYALSTNSRSEEVLLIAV